MARLQTEFTTTTGHLASIERDGEPIGNVNTFILTTHVGSKRIRSTYCMCDLATAKRAFSKRVKAYLAANKPA
jgi:hypothetical protein